MGIGDKDILAFMPQGHTKFFFAIQIPQQPAAGSHGSSSFIQEQQSSAPLTVAAGEQAFQSDDSGGGGAQEGDQSLTTTAAAPPPPPINNKCCGVAVAVPRARSVQLPAAASGLLLFGGLLDSRPWLYLHCS